MDEERGREKAAAKTESLGQIDCKIGPFRKEVVPPLFPVVLAHHGSVSGVRAECGGHGASGGASRERGARRRGRQSDRRESASGGELCRRRRRRRRRHPREARGRDGGARSDGHGRDKGAEHAVWCFCLWGEREREKESVREKKRKSKALRSIESDLSNAEASRSSSRLLLPPGQLRGRPSTEGATTRMQGCPRARREKGEKKDRERERSTRAPGESRRREKKSKA